MADTSTIRRRFVDEALHELLTVAFRGQFPVGLVDIPDGIDLSKPKYCILTPIVGGEAYGPPLTAPEADVTLPYDVTSVGEDRRQCSWVGDQVRRVMTARGATGALLYPLDCEGHGEMDRESAAGGFGAATFLSGIWQQVDSYMLTVTRTDDGNDIDPEE